MSGWREEAAWAVGDALFVLLALCLLPLLLVAMLVSALGERARPPHPAPFAKNLMR